jgi:hypothetical protein
MLFLCARTQAQVNHFPAELQANWKAKEAEIKALFVQWTETRTKLNSGNTIADPRREVRLTNTTLELLDHTYRWETKLKAPPGEPNVTSPIERHFSDGMVLTTFSGLVEGTNHPGAIIRKLDATEVIGFQVQPFVIQVRPLTYTFSAIDPVKARVRRGGLSIDGDECILIEVGGTEFGNVYWVNPSKSFAIQRIQAFSGTMLTVQLDIEFERPGDFGICAPKAWRYVRYSSSGDMVTSVEATVTKFIFNPPLDRASFGPVSFPVGTVVNDYRTEPPVVYAVQADNPKRIILQSERKAGYDTVMATPTGGAIPTRPIVYYAIALLIVCALIVLVLYRRYASAG